MNSALAQSYTYTVYSIPYNPYSYNSSTQVLANIDDTWSGTIPLPFSFSFFGNLYTKLIIGSNGIVSFDTSKAKGYCPWPLTIGVNIPSSTYPINSIMGPYQDLDPTKQGSIYYNIIGAFPYRVFVVSFYQIPYYGDPNSVSTGSCPNPLFATSQIVLYESTNVIEIYIQNKESCSGWNGGLAIEGIQDSAGTNAYVVPGRNNIVWTDTSDAWRFTPGNTYLSEFDATDFILISPNPSIGVFTLTLQQTPNQNLEIEIFNSLGQRIGKDILNAKTKTIDISTSPKGIYFLKVSFEGKYLFRKIIIE